MPVPMTSVRTSDGGFPRLMKQAAQLQSKMQAMQAELDQIEVEGTAVAASSRSRFPPKATSRALKSTIRC